MNNLLLTFYGDDFTGSTDALDFLTRAGAKTALFIEPPSPNQLARYPGLRAIGVAGMTRAMAPEHMAAELQPALTALKSLGVAHVHYKVCSTFDSGPAIGNIGRVIELGMELFQARFVPLLVGAPALGRYSVFGNLFARLGTGPDGPVHRLDRHPSMATHPITPMAESDLRKHLAQQTSKRIALFDVLHWSLPPQQQHAALERILADRPDVVLFDMLFEDQLPLAGSLIDAHAQPEQSLFTVGSSGVEMALGAHWESNQILEPVAHWTDPGPAEPLLVVSGSCSPVTETQIAWAIEHGFTEVALDTLALVDARRFDTEIDQATAAARRSLANGTHVLVHTSRGPDDPRISKTAAALAGSGQNSLETKAASARLFGTGLGTIIARVVESIPVRRIGVAGGDTASYIARTLGIEAVEMLAPIAPGAPLCIATAPNSPAAGLEVNFKGGQVGQANYFGILANGS